MGPILHTLVTFQKYSIVEQEIGLVMFYRSKNRSEMDSFLEAMLVLLKQKASLICVFQFKGHFLAIWADASY